MFLNDIEEQFVLSGLEGLDMNMLKIFILLFADDKVLSGVAAVRFRSCIKLLQDMET